ncbi:hypothetical protein GCM10023195_00410 [Actinoallomurus liliacearum]|uniref:YcaO domain-containing protein n=1 Tax=Actinoallomurus liliacearum TaxID=1080073 RepID=A0ABP8TCD7_9ACTN
MMAVRPLGATLSVSQGKGATLLLAKISAAMEAVELWHAENAVPSPELINVPASALDLPYPVPELGRTEDSLLTEWTRLDWIGAQSIPRRSPAMVPRGAVRLGHSPLDWRIHGLTASSNGLASGNTVAEATVHAGSGARCRQRTDGRAGVGPPIHRFGERDRKLLCGAHRPHRPCGRMAGAGARPDRC